MNTNYRAVAKEIKALYTEMDKVNDTFSKLSGLSCVSSCAGVCCKNSDVEVSPIDLLPLVLELFDQNQLEAMYALAKESANEACMFHKQGKCSIYSNRATLCRLFSYASVYDKAHKLQLSVCSWIKAEQNTNICPLIVEQAANLPNWSQKVRNLLPSWDQSTMPFNQAFIYAAERYLLTQSYAE